MFRLVSFLDELRQCTGTHGGPRNPLSRWPAARRRLCRRRRNGRDYSLLECHSRLALALITSRSLSRRAHRDPCETHCSRGDEQRLGLAGIGTIEKLAELDRVEIDPAFAGIAETETDRAKADAARAEKRLL